MSEGSHTTFSTAPTRGCAFFDPSATICLAYCLMPNHWHLVLWPRQDGDLSEFMRWVTVTHTQRRHASARTAGRGHIYQGRYKSFPIQTRRLTAEEQRGGLLAGADPVLSVVRYVERNALRAALVRRAENWRWCSLWRRVRGDAEDRAWLSDPMGGLPVDWVKLVNRAQSEKELGAIRRSVQRGVPYGSDRWVNRTVKLFGLDSTLRPRGRPRKEKGS